MTTDFSYGEKQIVASGPFKPSGKNMPVDARTRVNTYADIVSIPNPFIGMRIIVLADETNSNKMTDYIVKSLKADDSGIADMAINEVVRYVDYLGANKQSIDTNNFATKEELGLKADKTELHSHINKTVLDGITSTNVDNWNNKVDKVEGKTLTTNDYTTEEKTTLSNLKTTVGNTSSGLVKDVKDLKTNGVSQDNINTAIENYLTEHPVQSGATAEQAAQIEANRTAIGDSNSGLTKEINNINNALTRVDAITLNGKKFSNPMTKEEYDSIVNKDENTIYLVDDNNVITGIPDYSTADANKLLAVNSTGTALAWVNAPSGTGTGTGLTSEQVTQLTTAYNHSQSHHVATSDIPTKTSQLFNDSGFLTNISNEEIKNAVNEYMTNNPISVDNIWADLEENEKFYVDGLLTVKGIRADFVQGSNVVFNTSSLDSLKGMLTVYKIYTDDTESTTTNYTLRGNLLTGTSTITVSCEGFTDTFNVVVTERPAATVTNIAAVYTQGNKIIRPSTPLNDLKQDLVVTATYSDSTTANVSDYEITGTLTANTTSTMTVTYEGFTATFNVVVSEDNGYVTDSLETYYNFTTYEDGYTGEITDLSGNATECRFSNVPDSYIAGVQGFVGNKLQINAGYGSGMKKPNSPFYINSNSQRSYPYTIEFEAGLRVGYSGMSGGKLVLYPNPNTAIDFLSTRYSFDDVSCGGGLSFKFKNLTETGLKFEMAWSTLPSNTTEEVPNVFIASSDGIITTPNIYHITLIVRGNGLQDEIYVNGNLVYKSTNNNHNNLDNNNSCIQLAVSDLYMLRIYNKALSSAEVTRNFKQVEREIKEVSK